MLREVQARVGEHLDRVLSILVRVQVELEIKLPRAAVVVLQLRPLALRVGEGDTYTLHQMCKVNFLQHACKC